MKSRKHLRGLLFVLEGIDGSGKTAVCESLVSLLTKEGHGVLALREPTNLSKWGLEIRARSVSGELTPDEELELFIRDREWHIKNRILPALRAGRIVVMDRYFFATGAYQSTSTGIHWKDILRRNREEIHAPEPDLVLLLDVPANIGLQRVLGRKCQMNEQFEKLDRLVRVREAYLEMARQDTANFFVIDATQPLEQVVSEVHQRIEYAIKQRREEPT